MICPTNNCDFFLIDHLVPAAGAVLVLWIFISPLKSMRKVQYEMTLADVNPLPSTMIMCNSMAWFLYGLFLKDFYISGPNVVGITLGLYYTLIVYRFADNVICRRIKVLGLVWMSIIFTITLISFIWIDDTINQNIVLGVLCNCTLLCFYISPLSELYHVIKTENAASFSISLTCASFFAALLWSIYGMVLNNLFVTFSNTIGAVIGIIQLICIVIYKQEATNSGLFGLGVQLNVSDYYDAVEGQEPEAEALLNNSRIALEDV